MKIHKENSFNKTIKRINASTEIAKTKVSNVLNSYKNKDSDNKLVLKACI